MTAAIIALALLARPARASDPDPWFARDKALHFGISAGLAAGTYAGAAALFESRGHALLAAGGVTLAVGAGKEIADLAGYGTPSWKDFAWDVAGTLVGLGVAWGIDLALRGTSDVRPALAAPRGAHALVLAF